MTALRLWIFLLAALCVGGCVPFPNIHYYAPAVSGRITQDGVPVQGAEVRVSGQFSEEVRSTSTAQDGSFATEPIRELQLTAALLGDPIYAYSVAIAANGKQYSGYLESRVGYAPDKLEVQCDLSRPVKLGPREVYCLLVVGAR